VRAVYRYFWDTWKVRASTTELGYSRHAGSAWVADGALRYYAQRAALFYSDNFASELTYMSRNRQLSTFNDLGAGGTATYTALRVPGRYDVKLSASVQRLRFHYSNFTDIRTGRPYSFNASVIELNAIANF